MNKEISTKWFTVVVSFALSAFFYFMTTDPIPNPILATVATAFALNAIINLFAIYRNNKSSDSQIVNGVAKWSSFVSFTVFGVVLLFSLFLMSLAMSQVD